MCYLPKGNYTSIYNSDTVHCDARNRGGSSLKAIDRNDSSIV